MNWLAYTRTGTEAEIIAKVGALALPGLEAHAPIQIEAKRLGNERRPKPVESPVLPRIIFMRGSAEAWHRLMRPDFRRAGLSATTMQFSDRAWAAHVAPFLSRCNAAYDDMRRRIEAGERIAEYAPGDELRITDGPFADRVARFVGMVERAHDMHPRIRAEFELMGQTIDAELDPLMVKRA